MYEHAQRLFHVGACTGDLARAQLAVEEGDELVPPARVDRNREEACQQVVDDLGGIGQMLPLDESREIETREQPARWAILSRVERS